MSNFASKLWDWLFNRSPKNAAMPDVQPGPAGDTVNSAQPPGAQPVEINVISQSCIGLLSRLSKEDRLMRGPDGEVVRVSDQVGILPGCEHVVIQLQAVDEKGRHIRGIAGICSACFREYQRPLEKGQISTFDAERLSLVCTDCGKITISGQLCCPKHYTSVVGPDGSATYLDEEQAREMKRQNTVRTALSIVNFLFGEDQPKIPDRQDNEQKNAPNPISIHLGHIIHYDRHPGPQERPRICYRLNILEGLCGGIQPTIPVIVEDSLCITIKTPRARTFYSKKNRGGSGRLNRTRSFWNL